MNELLIRTNKSDYACGSTVHGAVYLRIFKPVAADCLDISIFGRETCKWTRILTSIGPSSLPNRVVRTDSLEEDSINESAGLDPEVSEFKTTHISFDGDKVLFTLECSIASYSGGTIPLGCYAYPFQFILRQGLPNSFRKKNTRDEVKSSSYEAAVEYKITAKLRCKSSTSQPNLKAATELMLRNEDFILVNNEGCQKFTRAKVASCCCFPKGEIMLNVQLDKSLYKLGDTVEVKCSVENKSDVDLNLARVKLVRTIALMGKAEGSEEGKLDTPEAFPSEVYNIQQNFDIKDVKKGTFVVMLPLAHEDLETLSSTLGLVIKCRYQLEVEIVVPWDADVSVFLPIKVNPGPLTSWLEWRTPAWIKEVKVTDADGICKVPRLVLESGNFANVPLPLEGL